MMRMEETVTIDLLHRAVPARHTDEALRALSAFFHASIPVISMEAKVTFYPAKLLLNLLGPVQDFLRLFKLQIRGEA